MDRDDLCFTPASELARMIRSKEVSAREATDAVLDRIVAVEPHINSFVTVSADEARRDADAADAAVQRGEDLGPLHGVPTALKDLFDFKPGWPNTFGGVRAMKDFTLDARCGFSERPTP